MSTSDPEPPAPTSLPDVDEPGAVEELPVTTRSDDLPTDAQFAADEQAAGGEIGSADIDDSGDSEGSDAADGSDDSGDSDSSDGSHGPDGSDADDDTDAADDEIDAAVEAMDFDGEVPDAAEYYGYDEVYPWETEDEGPRVPPKRHKGGGGVMLGAAMLGLRDVLYGKPKEDTAIEIEASGDPPNVDLDGMDMAIDENRRAVGPPLDDIKARAVQNRRARRRPSAS